MAIKTSIPKSSKGMVFGFTALIFFGWLILLVWVISLWCFTGFNNALTTAIALLQKQTQAITGFNSIALAEKAKLLLSSLPTESITYQLQQTTTFISKGFAEVLPSDTTELNDVTEDLFYISKEVWLLTSLITQIMLVKIIILISAIPLFLLASTAGLVDGLNQRAIRTASLGRESSYVFHQLNRYLKRILLLLLSLWLAFPISIIPAFVFIPVSLMLSIMVSMTASRFKKYL